MQHSLDFTEIPIAANHHPLAGVLNELWQKIYEEEVIKDGPFVQQFIFEAKNTVLETADFIAEALSQSDSVDQLAEEIRGQIMVLLKRPKSRSFAQRILREDLPLLQASFKYKKLRNVLEPIGKPKFLTDESNILLNDGRIFEVEECGYVAGSQCSVYRVYGKFQGSNSQTYVVKSDSAGDVLEWRTLKSIGLPVFDTYLPVSGGVLMDDLDENGERLTISMNCLSGVSWRYLRDHPVEIFNSFNPKWVEQYFECSLRAGRAGRFIPAIVYFFNCGKSVNTDLRFMLGDYGELESFRNKIIPSGSDKSLSWYNLHEARRVLASFLQHALHFPANYLDLLSEVYARINRDIAI